MNAPSADQLPAETRNPVILLRTAAADVCLRASFDQRDMLYLALVHVETDAALCLSVHTPQGIRPAAGSALQAGAMVYLLAHGEIDRLFSWLRAGGHHPKGTH